jgi:hypothetical protein
VAAGASMVAANLGRRKQLRLGCRLATRRIGPQTLVTNGRSAKSASGRSLAIREANVEEASGHFLDQPMATYAAKQASTFSRCHIIGATARAIDAPSTQCMGLA